MIEFVTLLLGLVAGVQTVEVTVDDRVARVEMLLDGATIATIEGSPWLVQCDFGPLAPHELVAVAWDSSGRETARTRQWVNLPRRRTEVRLAVSRAADGTQTARLIYSALDFATPKSIEVTLDGSLLDFEDPQHIELPVSDSNSLHFLRAQVELPNEEQVRAELVFGGLYSEEIGTELTALLMAKDGRHPKPQDMQGWLEKSGQPLDVVAVEKGPVELFFIREKSPATLEALTGIYRRFRRDRANSRLPHEPRTLLQKNDRLRFVFPTGESPTQEPERLVVRQGATHSDRGDRCLTRRRRSGPALPSADTVRLF